MDRHSSYSAPRSERASGSYGSNRGRSSKRNTYNKRSWNDNRKLHTLVFYILPFILINLVIFILATSTPKIEYDASDTKDYRSVDISIRIRSLLPIREMSVTMESQPLEMEKEKGVYKATLTNNGTLQIFVKGWNGMSARLSDTIQALDDMAPTIQEDYVMENGILTITAEDSQSGINFDAVYATDEDEKTVKPSHINKESGEITFPMDTQTLVVFVEDYAGNTIKSSYTSLKDGLDLSNRDTEFPSDGTNGTNGSGSKGAGTDKETSKAKESTKAKETTKAAESTKAKESTAATTAAPPADPQSPSPTQASQAPSPTQASQTPSPTQAPQTPSPTQTPQSPSPTQTSQAPSPDNGSGDNVTIVPLG
uniref:hypothetical protein n=1 Tax=Enterocloster clostridioformis TaxID=1531 RepID=UPI00332B7F4D